LDGLATISDVLNGRTAASMSAFVTDASPAK